jgi:hypothetical protein
MHHLVSASKVLSLVSGVLAFAFAIPAQCSNAWLPGDGMPGTDGSVAAMTLWDPDGSGPSPLRLVLAGQFVVAAGTVASRIVAWDPVLGSWLPLGPGITSIDGNVRALAVLPNGDLVAAGEFSTAGGLAVNHIARWDGTSWHDLAGGVSGSPVIRVHALAVLANGDLVAAGWFALAGGVAVNGFARWDGGSWSAFPAAPINGTITALLAMPNGDLVAGGTSVARWNGTSWTPLAPSGPFEVRVLRLLANGELVGGGAGSTAVSQLARWNGTAWIPYGSGFAGGSSYWGTTFVSGIVELPNGDLIVAGNFTSAGGVAANHVARWNGSAWSAIGAGLTGSPSASSSAPPVAFSLAQLPGGDVIVGGLFRNAGSVPANCVARWDGAAWGALAPGTNDAVLALRAAANSNLLAGGRFTMIGGVAANCVARWDGASWLALGAGTDGPVHAVAVLPNGDVVVGGQFTTAGGIPANNIARWNGTAWSALGAGLTGSLAFFETPVRALTVRPNGDLIAGGGFQIAGGVSAPHVARWNGTSWSSLGPGMTFSGSSSTSIHSLITLPNGDIVAGGIGFSVGASQAIARWNGTAWSPFAGTLAGTPPFIRALLPLPSGTFLAGGQFSSAAGVPGTGKVALWTGSSWAALGGGLPFEVYAMTALANGDIAVAGSTNNPAFGAAAARWDGTAWSALGTPTNGLGAALTTLSNGDLVLGGFFQTAGGLASAYHARLTTTCPAAAVPNGAACAGSSGSNTLAAANLPWAGSTFRADGTGLPALAIVAIAAGFTPTGGVPLTSLPLPQTQPGCFLHLLPEYLDFTVPTAGAAQVDWALPASPGLAGVVAYLQLVCFEIDPAANVLATTSTNGLQLTVGSF